MRGIGYGEGERNGKGERARPANPSAGGVGDHPQAFMSRVVRRSVWRDPGRRAAAEMDAGRAAELLGGGGPAAAAGASARAGAGDRTKKRRGAPAQSGRESGVVLRAMPSAQAGVLRSAVWAIQPRRRARSAEDLSRDRSFGRAAARPVSRGRRDHRREPPGCDHPPAQDHPSRPFGDPAGMELAGGYAGGRRSSVLHCGPQIFEILGQSRAFGLFRRNDTVKLKKIKRLKSYRYDGGRVDERTSGWSRPGAARPRRSSACAMSVPSGRRRW